MHRLSSSPVDYIAEAEEVLIQDYFADGGTDENWEPSWEDICDRADELWNERANAFMDWADDQAAEQRLEEREA